MVSRGANDLAVDVKMHDAFLGCTNVVISSLNRSFGGESEMLKGILQSLFGSPRIREPLDDRVLGRLEPVETGWTAKVEKGADTFEFTIGGVNCQPTITHGSLRAGLIFSQQDDRLPGR